MTTEFWIGLVIQLVTMAVLLTVNFMASKTAIEVIKTKIGYLEDKQDKHNSLIERMVKAEQSTASAHHRLDEGNDSHLRIENSLSDLKNTLSEHIGGSK